MDLVAGLALHLEVWHGGHAPSPFVTWAGTARRGRVFGQHCVETRGQAPIRSRRPGFRSACETPTAGRRIGYKTRGRWLRESDRPRRSRALTLAQVSSHVSIAVATRRGAAWAEQRITLRARSASDVVYRAILETSTTSIVRGSFRSRHGSHWTRVRPKDAHALGGPCLVRPSGVPGRM